ncbi:type I-U CRISPR-associated protein Cas7 [Chelatococcus composti]|nr:type I-U CRISPR-associated protein Cas7 [Chelatococcus composti]
MDIRQLNGMVEEGAALRRRQILQPVGGKGDKIFPPTYPGRDSQPRHVYEKRRVNGEDVWCVLVDSVQSQANRLEESLLAAIADGVPIPHVEVDFTEAGLEGISRITSLDAPHRVYDAILRDSLYDGKGFMDSDVGQRLAKAKAEDASALLEISPTALLFGAWHSTGQGGGLGAKFARSLVSEIVAVNVPVEDVVVNPRTGEIDVQTSGRRTRSRIDPLGVLRNVKVFRGADDWSTTKEAAGKNAKEVKPSAINHGNIPPSVQPLGITCDYLEHSFVLSFAALRRLRFGGGVRDAAGRALVAALGLVALTEQDARGYALRSRCDLVCDGKAPLEFVRPDGSTEAVEIDRPQARALYQAAYDAALDAGFSLSPEPLRLTPQEKLVAIVKESQRLALARKGGDEDEAGSDDVGSRD